MIPLRLRLEGFLSYAKADLDLTGFDVVCLTGSNGQGKSALLDAMTYATFGCARGCENGQNQERLIRDGAERATVDFTFELGGDRYRIVRSRTTAGKAELQLMIATGDGWTNAAGESLRETEAKISRILRMDYKSFVASAFLLQGRADDFLARMKPEERKDVFARLLDLGSYEQLEDAARAKAREAEARRRALRAALDGLESDSDALDAARRELAEAEGTACAAAAGVEDAEKEWHARRDELARLQRQREQLEAQIKELDALGGRLEEDRTSLAAAEDEIRTVDALAARLPEVERALADAATLEAGEAAFARRATRAAELEATRAGLRARIEAERGAIAERRSERAALIQRTNSELSELAEAARRLAKLDALLQESAGTAGALEEVAEQLSALRAEDARMGSELGSLEAQEAETAERRTILRRGEGECPVCGGPLDASHRRSLDRELAAALKSLASDRRSRESRREEVRKEGKRLREEEGRLRKTLAQREQLVATGAQMRGRCGTEPAVRERLRELRAQDAADEALLASGSPPLTSELEAVSAELTRMGYDEAEHSRVKARLAELAEFRVLRGRIEEASSRRERVVRQATELGSRIRTDEEALMAKRLLLEAAAEDFRAIDAVASREAAGRRSLEDARVRAAEAAAAVVRLGERISGLEEAARRADEVSDQEGLAAGEHRTYERLAQAFGRKGIPALIIENALPELEQEANIILGDLTNQEMSLMFRRDKLTKSGKPRETFDVQVHHDGGVRDFQMFSGGEAFRIAFAIRLALSKLLVRRAGARLETLVIDEGFGTQDAEGRERLLEAINVARKEFRKILVISHLDDLKDAFPAQLRVTKDPVAGSVVELVA
jgi:exonuclease SbcC